MVIITSTLRYVSQHHQPIAHQMHSNDLESLLLNFCFFDIAVGLIDICYQVTPASLPPPLSAAFPQPFAAFDPFKCTLPRNSAGCGDFVGWNFCHSLVCGQYQLALGLVLWLVLHCNHFRRDRCLPERSQAQSVPELAATSISSMQVCPRRSPPERVSPRMSPTVRLTGLAIHLDLARR